MQHSPEIDRRALVSRVSAAVPSPSLLQHLEPPPPLPVAPAPATPHRNLRPTQRAPLSMLKNAALSGPFATQIIHEPIKDKDHGLLPRWAHALLGRGSRMRCHHQSPAYGRSSWRLCNDLGELRGPRLEVVRPRGIPDEGCLAISVGIGNSWEFEDALTALHRYRVECVCYIIGTRLGPSGSLTPRMSMTKTMI